MNTYTKDDIFERKLLTLLPFYVLRYEDRKKDLNENPKELKALLTDYQDIQKHLETAIKKSVLYEDLIEIRLPQSH